MALILGEKEICDYLCVTLKWLRSRRKEWIDAGVLFFMRVRDPKKDSETDAEYYIRTKGAKTKKHLVLDKEMLALFRTEKARRNQPI